MNKNILFLVVSLIAFDQLSGMNKEELSKGLVWSDDEDNSQESDKNSVESEGEESDTQEVSEEQDLRRLT
jgi:hypothetical protein